MQPELINLMHQRVRTIYRALTGADIPDAPAESSGEMPVEEVTRRFVELETLARTDPFVADRIPPFSFTPWLDACENGNEIVVELAVPGVDRDDVSVGLTDGLLVISGYRREHAESGRETFSHAEIPRGPFYRELRLPWPVEAEPVVGLNSGLLTVRLTKSPASSPHDSEQ